MKQYLNIIQKELSSVTEADLYIPIRETNIDSIDIVVIRVALEKHFKHVISDSTWYNFQTLSEGLEYFHNTNKDAVSNMPNKEICISETIEVRMPQMANSALSENWLLKYIGDTHWSLLTTGLKLCSSEIKDELGNRVYATFIRICYTCSSLNNFSENEKLEFTSTIKGFGNSTYLSQIEGSSNFNKISASLMTTFSIRHNSKNGEMSKAVPSAENAGFEQISQTPIFLNDYRLLKKGLLEEYGCYFGKFSLRNENIFVCEYQINPFYDINGVGLLYFASYASIADKCCLDYFKKHNAGINFCDDYHTVYRDIFYYANCESDDTIIFELNDHIFDDSQLKIACSLFRKSDNEILSKIFVVKQKQ